MLMRSTMLLVVSSALLLAACGSEDSGAATTDGTTAAAASPTRLGLISEPLRAGLYNITQDGDVEIEEERCFTAENIAAGRFGVPNMAGEGWTLDTNRMSGGTIEVAARHPSGSRLTITGTYEKEAFVTDGTLEMKLNGETHIVRTQQRGRFASSTCPDDMD